MADMSFIRISTVKKSSFKLDNLLSRVCSKDDVFCRTIEVVTNNTIPVRKLLTEGNKKE